MTTFYPGIAGRRNGKIQGVVIHNDYGSQYATAAFYREMLKTHPAENGFAHVYIAEDGRYQPESYENMAWHTANSIGNGYYVGWEVCQSRGDVNTFLRNEQAVFKDIAGFMKQYGLYPNRDTVKLHMEFSATSCPHRSMELHGGNVEAVRNYFISQIKKYMGDSNNPELNENNNANEGDVSMYALYYVPNKKTGVNDIYYFNGFESVLLKHTDEVRVLKEIYQKNNGKPMPEFKWTDPKAPWFIRLQAVAPVRN